MTKDIRTERRWLRSVIAASAEPLPAFPWMRGQKAALARNAAASPDRPMQRREASLFGRKAALAAR